MKFIVNDSEYKDFASYTIKLKFDSIASSFSFDGKTDFFGSILDYPPVQVIDEDKGLLLTGNILFPDLVVTPKPELKSVSGYSKTGKLQDVSIPIDLYPLQFDNLSLTQITDKILSYFDIGYKIDSAVQSEMNKSFEKINDNPGGSPSRFINKLASQRNILLSHNERGELVFTRLNPQRLTPVMTIDQTDTGIKQMKLTVDSRAMHSSITVMRQASKDNPDAGEATIYNPYVDKSEKRPKVQTSQSGDIFDVEKAARNELSKELAGIKLTIETTKFVKPGQLIELRSDELKIPNFREFFVQETEIRGNAKRDDRYTLKCVPKDVYTDNKPENIFL